MKWLKPLGRVRRAVVDVVELAICEEVVNQLVIENRAANKLGRRVDVVSESAAEIVERYDLVPAL